TCRSRIGPPGSGIGPKCHRLGLELPGSPSSCRRSAPAADMQHRPRRSLLRRSARRFAYLPPCQESDTAILFRAMCGLSAGSNSQLEARMSDVMDKLTTGPISTRKHGDVLIVLSNNPPVNALSTSVR